MVETALRHASIGVRCELQFFFAEIRQAIWRWKDLDLGCLNMQFQQDWPKDEKLTAL